ncbi:MAG: hypothetical protein GKR87_05700 [Kiritimatiellae bacterium]|nr:hypothetical protein [Kiritimatiellia bacterium]
MKKKFDAVAYQQKVREKLSRKYCEGPDAFMRKLKVKYGEKHPASAVIREDKEHYGARKGYKDQAEACER